MSNQLFKNETIRYVPTPVIGDKLTIAVNTAVTLQKEADSAASCLKFDTCNGQPMVMTSAGGVDYFKYVQSESTKPYYNVFGISSVDSGATELTILQDCVLCFELAMPMKGGTDYNAAQVQIVAANNVDVRRVMHFRNPIAANSASTVIGSCIGSCYKGERVRLALMSETSPVTIHTTSVGGTDFQQDAFISAMFWKISLL
jgi:hypothetical protein